MRNFAVLGAARCSWRSASLRLRPPTSSRPAGPNISLAGLAVGRRQRRQPLI